MSSPVAPIRTKPFSSSSSRYAKGLEFYVIRYGRLRMHPSVIYRRSGGFAGRPLTVYEHRH